MKVIVSPQAIADIIAIGDFIAADDPERARSFVDELHRACASLRQFPRRHPPFPAAGGQARRMPYGSYSIIYEVADQVTVLTVVHSARDIDALF